MRRPPIPGPKPSRPERTDIMTRLGGRRGMFLRLMGGVHLLLGISYAVPEPSAGVSRSLGFLVDVHFPIWVAGVLWILNALAVFYTSFKKPGQDAFGFQALISLEVAWASIYLLSWVFSDYGRGWVLATIYLGLAGAVYTVSGMISASDVIILQHHYDDGVD